MTQVNLLPGDVKVEQQVRRTTALVVSAAVAVVALLFFVFVLQSARLARSQDQLTQQESVNSDLNTKIAGLLRFEDLKKEVAAREAQLMNLQAGEILWSGVLRDASIVIPDQVFLTSVSGTLYGGPGVSAGGVTGMAGNIQFTGEALDYPTVSKWLTRLEEVTGWVNPWVGSATKSGADNRITFSGSVDLTSDATVHGAPQ
jgi:Tfp pilus assembly protein PilN